jgi:Protein kinase domain
MLNFNYKDQVLHAVNENKIPVSGHNHQIKVEIYGTDAKVSEISAFTFHPNRTNFWNCIKDWVIELFYGKTVLLMKVKDHPSFLYMRVDELSQVLKTPYQKIQQNAKNGDISDFLVANQITKTIEKIKNIDKNVMLNWTDTQENSINHIINKIGYKNIFNVIDHPQFDSGLMLSTLIEVGKNLASNSVGIERSVGSYGYQLTSHDIYIWKMEGYKKTKIHLNDLEVTVQDLTPPPLPPQLPSKTSFKTIVQKLKTLLPQSDERDECKIVFFNAIARIQVKINEEEKKKLQALADRVSYLNLISVLGHVAKEDKEKMIKTFIQIGENLSLPAFFDNISANFRLKYVKKNKNLGTYAFAINKKEFFIAEGKLGEGAFKTVSKAIKLNNLEPFARIKIKEKKNKTAEEELKKEANFLKKLHEHTEEGTSCIAIPFSCEIKSGKDKKLVFFQKKYDGEGTKLGRASFMHQVNALRDVAAGLAHIHRLGYVHMDMKPANFLIEGDLDSQKIPVKGKVSDFGLTLEKDQFLLGGTPLFLPPEAFRGKQFSPFCPVNEKIDSFCLGVTILQIMDEKILDQPLGWCSERNVKTYIQKFRDSFAKKYYAKPMNAHLVKEHNLKLEMLAIAEDLLKFNPNERLSCSDAAARLDKITKTI